MKEIIYLNTDLLNSFMAQMNKGLPLSNTTEQLQQDQRLSSDATKKSGTNEVQGEVNTGAIDVPFIFTSPSAKATYKYSGNKQFEETISLTQIDAGKEIISKQLHDNALDDYEDYLVHNQGLNILSDTENGETQIGNYVKIKSTFSLFDLEFLKNLTDPDAMRDIIMLSTDHNPIPVHSNSKNGGKNKGPKQKLQPSIEKGIHGLDVILKYLSSILPTQLYLKQGGYIAPLKPEYLRESSRELNFKYGVGSSIEVTLLGRVTKIFESFEANIFEESGNLIDLSRGVNEMVEFVLSEINSIKKGDVIVSPVAIYFE